MRCKPGDLAVIVRSHDSRNIGKLVTIHGRHHVPDSWWCTATCTMHSPFLDFLPGEQFGNSDRNMRPIRDPGEDAQDEMLRPLPAPSEPIPA